jgi:apolipoprotein N-acyltransferase
MKRILNFLSFLPPSVATAVLLVLSFPNYELAWLAWIAFVPLFLEIQGKKPWQSFFICLFCGVVFYVAMTPWVHDFPSISKLGSLVGYLYLSLYFGLFGLSFGFVLRRTAFPLLIAAPLWTLLEYIRSNLSFLSFPWAIVGHTQYKNLPLIQMATLTGAYGVTVIVILVNGAIADVISRWLNRRSASSNFQGYNPYYGGVAVFLITIILWGAGWIALTRNPTGKSLSVAVVQGNIPQERKWNRQYRGQILSQYETLTEEAARNKPDLIVWPEASTPGLILKDMSLYQRMVTLIRRINTYLLVGSAEYPKFLKGPVKLRSGNTALYFSPEGKVLNQYIKIRLVPFGEYVPLEGIIKWPESIVSKTMTSHISGKEFTILNVDETRFCALICWEILFPDLSRTMVKNGAEFVINISNEAWFGKSDAPYQMLSMAVFRAVENRVNLVRATNTGISCFIDPHGRITGKVTNGSKDIFVAGTLSKQIFLSPQGTFYTHYGDIFAFGCIAISFGLIAYAFLGKHFGRLKD